MRLLHAPQLTVCRHFGRNGGNFSFNHMLLVRWDQSPFDDLHVMILEIMFRYFFPIFLNYLNNYLMLKL